MGDIRDDGIMKNPLIQSYPKNEEDNDKVDLFLFEECFIWLNIRCFKLTEQEREFWSIWSRHLKEPRVIEDNKYTYRVGFPLMDTKSLLEQFIDFFKRAHEKCKRNKWKSYLLSMAMSLLLYEGEHLRYYYAAANTRPCLKT